MSLLELEHEHCNMIQENSNLKIFWGNLWPLLTYDKIFSQSLPQTWHLCSASDFKSIHIKTIQVNIKIYLLTFRCYIATSSELSNELTKVVSVYT